MENVAHSKSMQDDSLLCEEDSTRRHRWEPKIPTFGPAAQLSPRVLVPATARDRRLLVEEKGGKSAVSALPSLFQFGITAASKDAKISAANSLHCAIAPLSARARGRSGIQGTFHGKKAQSCEPRLQKIEIGKRTEQSTKGLWSVLCKGDQTHRLRDYPLDNDAILANEDRISRPFCSSQLSCRVPTPSRVGSASPVSREETVAADLSPRGPRSGQTRQSHPSSHRLSCLRASFHLDEEDIATKLMHLRRFQSTEEMEERSETENEGVARLITKFENCGLASRPTKNARIATTAHSDLNSGEDRVGLADDLGSTASSTEISTCVNVLNFYRYLCGLSPVRLNSARLDICNVVSLSLLPRVVPSVQLAPGAVEYLDALSDIMTQRSSSVGVLHGEASLLTMVEKCLSSADTLRNEKMAPVIDCGQHASQLAESVALRNPHALRPTSTQRKSLRSKATATSTNYYDSFSPQPILSSSELPEPLNAFKVFWDIQPGLSKDCQKRLPPSKSQRGARAIATHAAHSKNHNTQPLSSIWGDRGGNLAFRRHLLNPALREFGAARRHDTCVVWMGADVQFENQSSQKVLRPNPQKTQQKAGPLKIAVEQVSTDMVGSSEQKTLKSQVCPNEEIPAGALGAVCWPPAGIVPLSMVLDRSIVWSIMPNSARFQPTESLRLHAWGVKIDRQAGTAERLMEIAIKDFVVDCSALGEPFCVMFWPDFGQAVQGYQLEVQLSGLRGDPTTLHFFYEFKSFVQQELDEHFCATATTFRFFIGDYSFWGPPRECPELQLEEFVPLPTQGRRSIVQQSRTDKPPHKAPLLNMISYQEDKSTTNCVDITIVLQSREVAAISSKLFLVRFSGEEEEMPFGSVVQKLPASEHFLVRAKLPMRQTRFEIRFLVSTRQNPKEFKKHPFKYSITTSKECQSLLSVIDDRRLRKFGYAPIDAVGQLYGMFVLAPSTRRIAVGQCYFLVYVDRAIALGKALADIGQTVPKTPEQASSEKRRKTMLYTKRLSMPETDSKTKPRVVEHADPAPFDMQRRVSRCSSSSSKQQGPTTTIAEFQQRLRDMLEGVTKDTAEDIHLDVVLRNGEAIHRLTERLDFPGFYEGLYNFRESDIERTVELFFRFPLANASEYAPRKLGSWFVCRDESFPPNF